MKPGLGIYSSVVRLPPTVAVPLLGGCVMAVIVVFRPRDVVSTGSELVGGGYVLIALTLVGHATAGVVKAIESRKFPTVGLPPAELTAPNENLRHQPRTSAIFETVSLR
jgi:hypothetical protein